MIQSFRVLVVFFVLLSSCSGDPFFNRESYNLPDMPTHELTKVFEVEEAGEGNFFYMIKDIHFLNNGNLIVQNYPDQKLYEFTPNGELINFIGRKGRGPGEFIDIYESELLNDDNLHVIDLNYSRHQVMKKENGNWIALREPEFKRVLPTGMTQQVPELTFPVMQDRYMGIFIIHPGMNNIDTLTNYYKYTAWVDQNLKQVSRPTRLKPVQSLAIGEKSGQVSIRINNVRFFAAHYLYYPPQDLVFYITNASNKIISIDSTGQESEYGLLPYEHFPVDQAEIKKSLSKLSSNPYTDRPMDELFMSEALKHEPYYRNIALHKDQLWVQLAREDTTKPNWVVTTLSGEVLKSFIGPKNISGIKIHKDRMYGVEKSPDGAVAVVSYTLKETR